jgi:hypothetical protein
MQSYIEPGDTKEPSGTAVDKHHLSVGTHFCQHLWLFKKCLDITHNFLRCNLQFHYQNNVEVKSSSSMNREKNDMTKNQNSSVFRKAPQYKPLQVHHQTT